MIFLESPRFPERVAVVARMGPTYKTYVSETAAGVEVRDQQWSTPRTQFTFSHIGMTQEAHDELQTFFESRAGRAGAFRVKNISDYKLNATNSQLVPQIAGVSGGTAGAGYGVPTYLLRRVRTYGAVTQYKDITKPVSGKIYAVRGGVTVGMLGSPGHVSIDTTTGLATFVADQSKSISSHTVGAAHVFTLATAFSPNLAIGGRIYVTGVTGTAASILNGLSHAITNVSSAVITVSTVTTGLTASGGTAYFYPQPTETLTASGEFDYPCRFTSDEATFEVIGGNSRGLVWQWSGIDLIEVKDE